MSFPQYIREIFASGRKPGPRGFVSEWTISIALVLFGSSTLMQAYVIPTGSMEGTLLVGDHLFVDRMAYSDPGRFGKALLPYREIERGDLIVFPYPLDPSQNYVKRVMGLPGDRIHMENGQVIRNGQRLIEPYTQHIAAFPDLYRDNFPQAPPVNLPERTQKMLRENQRDGEIVVPPGMLFAMGDNRKNSSDSRYWGFVARDTVKGKPLFVYWTYDAPTEDWMSWSAGHLADVSLHFLTKTRWERMFLIPRSRQAEVAR